jgi:uncharacterized protein YjbI with pentapeptide repeats
MAKKAATTAKSTSSPDWMKPRLDGQKVCLAGRFEKYGRLTLKHLESYVTDEGGTVTETLDATCHLLVMKEPTGSSGHEKKVAQINAKGGSISVLSAQQLYDMTVPLQSEVEEMLLAGSVGHQRMAQRLATARMKPDRYHNSGTPYSIQNLSLKGQTVEGIPLWCVSMDQADLRETQVLALLEFQSHYEFGALTNSKLDRARLVASFTSLVDCSCRDADLSGSWLGGYGLNARCRADFTNSNLSGFHLANSDCSDSVFKKANLTKASFESSKVHNADFSGACLKDLEAKHADFKDCNFTKADFTGAELNEAKFENCNLTGAKFHGAMMTGTSLKNSVLTGTDFTDTNIATVNFDGADVSKAKGLKTPTALPKVVGPKLQELSDLVKAGKSFETTMEIQAGELTLRLKVSFNYQRYHASWSKELWADTLSDWSCQPKSAADGMLAAAGCWPDAVPLVHTVSAAGKGMKTQQAKLKLLATEAWCETYGVAVPDETAMKTLQASQQLSKNARRAQLLAILDDPNGVENWNSQHTVEWEELNPFSDFDLSKKTLNGVNFQSVHLENCRFEASSLVEADLDFSSYKGSNFKDADLTRLQGRFTNFENCIFTGANLSSANLTSARCKGATFCNANLSDTGLCETDLRSVNLTGAKLSTDPDLWKNATFDEATVFPKGFKIPATLKWKGKGIDPRAAKALKSAKTKGPIDIDQFMQLLQASVDKDRLKKATTMLKAERFRLFAQAADDHLAGVVKSQNDPDLVYSCRLTKDGNYSCCTQNLNVCGGLRGALCKHLLVLIIGMTKGGELDPTTVNQWIQASRFKKPELDKDAMGETLLRYKGAEAGDVDWRPMETIPEDYYSL